MKVKKVNRYYCDFCKKSGAAAGHMNKHERRCTMNPKRECGMCVLINGAVAEPMSVLLAILPDPADFLVVEEYIGLDAATEETMTALREATNNCPACILAALRQRGILDKTWVQSFNYKTEMETAMNEHNERQLGEGYY